jgi:hypothetical protein
MQCNLKYDVRSRQYLMAERSFVSVHPFYKAVCKSSGPSVYGNCDSVIV